MLKTVRISITKENAGFAQSDYLTSFDVASGSTALNLKTEIMESINQPFVFVKDILYCKSKEIKNDVVIDDLNGFKYYLTIK